MDLPIFTLILLFAASCFGQPMTLNDPAFLPVSHTNTVTHLPPITSGLIADYVFTEGSGTTAQDWSGNGNTCNLFNSPTWTSGPFDGALGLNGSSQYGDCGSAADLDNLSAITVCAWVKFNNFTPAYSGVFSKCEAAYAEFDSIYVTSSAQIAIYLKAGGCCSVSYDNTGSHTLSTGVWYFLSYTYDSATGLIGYVNAAQDGTATANGDLDPNTADAYLGADTITAGRYANATLGPVLIFERALSSAEISTLYASTY
jgi:hypothetical protein